MDTSFKNSNRSRFMDEKQSNERRRDIFVLILSHLRVYGYLESAAVLHKEVGDVLSHFDVADNIDLLRIVHDFEEYHEIKFGKKPKLSRVSTVDNARKNTDKLNLKQKGMSRNATTARRRISKKYGTSLPKIDAHISNETPLFKISSSGKCEAKDSDVILSKDQRDITGEKSNSRSPSTSTEKEGSSSTLFHSGISGSAICKNRDKDNNTHQVGSADSIPYEERLLKPLPDFSGDVDLRTLASSIQREIVQKSLDVTWDDIVDLEDAKRLVKEAVVTPLKYPQLFTGILSPWCGILLYGPPGTGKTMLAKAVATQSNTTFFNISASSIVSKYRGESEKLIKVLFDLARYHEPSVVFFDEIDSIVSHRNGGGGNVGSTEGGEHEGSRRMKTELLLQMDGLNSGNEHVFVLAASNLPWDLDPALLRRLDKRVFVPLPNDNARELMLKKYILPQQQTTLTYEDFDFRRLAALTKGYNGSDIKSLCKEAAMRPVRRVLQQLEKIEQDDHNKHRQKNSNKQQYALDRSKPVMKVSKETSSSDVLKLMDKNPICPNDLEESIKCTRPSIDTTLNERYKRWTDSFSST